MIDDSKNTTINVLTNNNENIIYECNKFPNEVIYHKFPENLHTSNSATSRHCDILNYIVKNLCCLLKNDYDYILMFDADMCFINIFDPNIELLNYDIISPKRIQWLSNKQISDTPIFEYVWLHFCFFNLKTITNISDMNLNTIPNTTTDTGAMIIYFLHNNPNYKIRYLPFSSGN